MGVEKREITPVIVRHTHASAGMYPCLRRMQSVWDRFGSPFRLST